MALEQLNAVNGVSAVAFSVLFSSSTALEDMKKAGLAHLVSSPVRQELEASLKELTVELSRQKRELAEAEGALRQEREEHERKSTQLREKSLLFFFLSRCDRP